MPAMPKIYRWLIAWGAVTLAGAPSAWADRVVLRDGRTREGTVLAQDTQGVTLQMGSQGLKMTVRIPAADVAEVQITPLTPATAPAPSPAPLPATPTPASTLPGQPVHPAATTRAFKALPAPGTQHFFREWILLGLGRQAAAHDPETLPPDQAALWTKATEDDAKKDHAAELVDLAILANMPAMDLRLVNKLCYRQLGILLGPHLGQLRWEQMQKKTRMGQFDLSGITALETPTLIGLLRGATLEAITPLKPYYPLTPAQAALPRAQRPPDPLAAITLTKAPALKEQANLAAAIISAQLKLEPDMPLVDKTFLHQHAGNIRAIIAKCTELEPLARAAAEKAERERKINEAKTNRPNQPGGSRDFVPPSFRQ